MGGSSAFFQFAGAVFDAQEGLATPDGATLTLNSAVTKAGLDPAKVAACAATPEVGAQVEASVKLAQSLNINQTPTLMVNGRQVPIGGVPYETIKQIVELPGQTGWRNPVIRFRLKERAPDHHSPIAERA